MSVAESEILTRIIAPDDPSLDRKVAEAVLTFGFKPVDRDRMQKLAEKAQLGGLTSDEQSEADSYERIGHFVSLLKSKARQSPKSA